MRLVLGFSSVFGGWLNAAADLFAAPEREFSDRGLLLTMRVKST
ncbi:hypothetical protein [Pelagibius sp.]